MLSKTKGVISKYLGLIKQDLKIELEQVFLSYIKKYFLTFFLFFYVNKYQVKSFFQNHLMREDTFRKRNKCFL